MSSACAVRLYISHSVTNVTCRRRYFCNNLQHLLFIGDRLPTRTGVFTRGVQVRLLRRQVLPHQSPNRNAMRTVTRRTATAVPNVITTAV